MAHKSVKIIKSVNDETDHVCILTNQPIGEYLARVLNEKNERERKRLNRLGSSIICNDGVMIEYATRKLKKEVYEDVVAICNATNQMYSGYISNALKESNAKILKRVKGRAKA